MGKKSKKKRCKNLSSSSSEEDEKAFKEQDATKKHRSTKRKRKDVNHQESCAEKQEKFAFPAMQDVSQSTREIKKPVYRLTKTQATDQKPLTEEKDCKKTKSVSLPYRGGSCSSKEKKYVSEKYSGSGSKTWERKSSKRSSKNIPQRREEVSKGSSDEKFSQRTSSKIKGQLMSPSLVPAELKQQMQNVLKRKYRAEEPPGSRKDRSSIKTREHSKISSFSKDSQQQKRELVENQCPSQHKTISKTAKPLCTEAKAPTPSHVSSKDCTPISSSNAISCNVKSTSLDAKSSSAQQPACSVTSTLTLNFKIPKMVQSRPVDSTERNRDGVSPKGNFKHGIELSDSGASLSNLQTAVQPAHSCLDVAPGLSSGRSGEDSFFTGKLPATSKTVAEPWCDEMQVVEKLHLARCEKRLEVNVMPSCGELTCMDIDPPEEGAPKTHCKQPTHQKIILVLDTNILLSHLDYVKRIISHGLGEIGFAIVLIPWVVLQEMEHLKKGRGLSGSVAHLAIPAIAYIYNSLKSRAPHLWGQSLQQASESSIGMNAENNDDRVLLCCLQYQRLYPECAVTLCTNDKNLCNKAILSGVKAFSKKDLEAEVGRFRHGLCPLQSIKTSILPHISPQVLSLIPSTDCTSVQRHSQGKTGLSVGLVEKDNKQLSRREDEEETKRDLSRWVSELEHCLLEVLSDVLEAEMKAAYGDLWLEIVYVKPPWTLQDVLQCFKKHWIAIFGHIAPRRKLQNVLNLIDFFKPGKPLDCSSTLAAIQEATELVKAFGKSSSRVPTAFTRLDSIFNKLQAQGETPASDIVMIEDNKEDRQPRTTQVSHQEVWAPFENTWSNVWQTSIEGFKALGFDPHTMQGSQPMGGPLPPQDALVHLHKLSSMVSQLLQAFSRILSSAPALEEFQTLLGILRSHKIINADSRLTAKDLRDCFSQQEYREKLRIGGNQLMELKGALDRCVETVGQHISFTM